MDQAHDIDSENDVSGHYLLNEQMAYDRVGERQREISRARRESMLHRAIADGRTARVLEVAGRRRLALVAPIAGLLAVVALAIGG